MRRVVGIGLTTLAVLACAERAEAACQRPNDPGGVNGYDYGMAPVSSFDGKNVRIWYTTTGPHAVNPATTRMDMVPDNVATAAKVADAALDSYVQMGFLPPISDNGTGNVCGGSPALDIYLMHFNAADGDAATENCSPVGKAVQCSSFAQVEARLEIGYGNFELGAHVVIAHEMFHSVQDAYDASLNHFYAEGTAQWAAKTLYSPEKDFENFLPSFFANANRSIDVTGGGVVADFLYGSAIWPQFLTEHVDPTAVRASLEQEAKLGPPSMASIGAALPAFKTTLADEYSTFVAWNAATGKRAGTGGYANAASYPQAAILQFPATNTVSDIISGYSSFYYAYDFGSTPQQLTITADGTRVVAKAFPLVGGKAQLDKMVTLPTQVTGPGVLVVVGVTGKKQDAPFTVTAPPPPVDPGPDAGTPPQTVTTTTTTSGCTMGGSTNASWLGLLALVMLARRRR